MSVKLSQENGQYGIIDNGIEAVPYTHDTPESAIDEWSYFERENNKKQFLPHKRTLEEIESIEHDLLNSSNIPGAAEEFIKNHEKINSDKLLIESIQNLIGYIDTPIGRRTYPDEVVSSVKNLKKWLEQNK